jgi:hypothetical protein
MPVQIHHINDDPSDNRLNNLAVLCVVCHDKTQITGGFGRKLNAGQVRRYRDDWLALVEARRTGKAVRFEPMKDIEPDVNLSTPATSPRTAARDSSGSVRPSDTSSSTKSTFARQLNLLAAQLNEQTQRDRQMERTLGALTGVMNEYEGALRRATIKTQLAKSRPEVSRATEELADELIRIVTDYSIQAYAYRRIELAVNQGFRDLLEMVKKIPRERWNATSTLRWVQSSTRRISARLRMIDSGQCLYNSANNLKGGSPRLDSILSHMQEAQMQTLKDRDKYLAWLKELEALTA